MVGFDLSPLHGISLSKHYRWKSYLSQHDLDDAGLECTNGSLDAGEIGEMGTDTFL